MTAFTTTDQDFILVLTIIKRTRVKKFLILARPLPNLISYVYICDVMYCTMDKYYRQSHLN